MKNFNLIEWLQTDSHGKQRVSSMRRYAAMLLLLIITCAHAWGTELFNLEVKASGSDVTVARQGGTLGLTTSNYLSSLSGGTATLENYNTSSGSSTMIATNSSTYQIKFGENTNTLKLVLSNALAEGDVITFTSTTSTEISFGLNTTRVTTPATSSKSYTIPAKSSLIGQTTIYLWRASGSTAYIKSVTITRPDPPTTWYVKGGWNSWGTTDNLKGSGTEISAKVNITTAGSYEFKIYNSSGDKWYGNGGNIGCNVSGWTFSDGGSNCKFFASETGNYIFTFNTSTKALSVTYPTAQGKYYYKNTSSWGSVAVYRYVGGINNGWPGTIVTETETVCGDTYYVTYADPGTTLIFNNNNGGSQTGNMTASGNAGKYVSGIGSSWTAFTYNVTYDKNGGTGTVPTDATNYSSGASVPVKDNTGGLTKSGYYFAGWNTKADGSGDTYVLGQTFSITSCTTLYAKWNAVSCPDGSVEGAVFKLQMNNVATKRSLAADEYINTAIYATMTNGSAIFGSTGTTEVTNANPGKLKFGANAVSLKLNLGCTLQAGDIISFTAGESVELSFATSSTRVTSPATSSKSYTIPAGSGLIGASTLYLWRASGSTVNVTSLTITRPAGCNAPSALAKSSVTASGVTLTVTDANDVDDYEFYVATASTAPTSGSTATHTVTDSKSKAITGLAFSTTYYAWARTKCGASNKSDWTALTGSTFTTSNTAPASPAVDPSNGWIYVPGESITLTASATASTINSSTTYTWYKGSDLATAKAAGAIQAAATAASGGTTYTIASCDGSDAGTYWCEISNGVGYVSSASYSIKIYYFNLFDNSHAAIDNYVFTSIDRTYNKVTVSVDLENTNYTYYFKVSDGISTWYGHDDASITGSHAYWDGLNSSGADVGLTSSFADSYTIDYYYNSNNIVVTYPIHNQEEDVTVYFDNHLTEMDNIYIRIGHDANCKASDAFTLVPGTANLYVGTTTEFNDFHAWSIADNTGKTGAYTIYQPWDGEWDGTGNTGQMSKQTNYQHSVVDEPITIIPTSENNEEYDCQYYNVDRVSGMKTDRVTISSYSNGTITVNYVNTSDEAASFTSGYADLAHTVILTSITAVPNTGYTIDDPLTINGSAYAANYEVTGATTVAASFKPATYSVTLNTNSGTINSGNITSYTYLTGATLPTDVTRSGYRFMGWYASSDFSTDRVYTIGTSEYGDKEYWAKWAQLYTITNGSPANGTITVASSAIAGETVSISAAANTGYVFDEWSIFKTGTPATTITPAAATASTNFTMPAYAVTVNASFIVKTYSLSYSIGTGATGAASGGTSAGSYAEGTTITVPAQGTLSNTGYTFRGWTDGTTFYLAGQTFSMPASNVTLSAVWDGGTSCTEYEVLLSNGSVTQESSTKPYGQYITGRGKIMRKGDGSDVTDLTTDGSCHSSTKYFQTGSGVIGLQTYNAINKVTVYAIATGGRTLSSIKTGTTLGTYGDDIQGDCEVIINGETDSPTSHITWSKNVCGEIEITFPNTLAANSYILITFSGNLYVYGAKFENCVVSNFKVSFADQTGFAGSSTLPDPIVGVPTGKKVLQPSNPTATGYIFGGWYSNAACTAGNEINWGTMTISADKTIYAKWTAKTAPTQYTVGGDTYYCPDETAEITLSGSQSGVSYQLKKGGSAQGDPKAGTGSALSWTGMTAGTYTVSAVENATYSARDMSGSVTVAAASTTAINTQPTTSVSAGASVNFTLGSGMVTAGHGLTYQWYSYTSSGGAGAAAVDGAESATYTTSKSAGTYYYKVKVSGDCGDPVYSSMITVTVKIAPTVYTLSGSTSICSGDDTDITLEDSDDGVTYKLYKGGVDQRDDKVGDGDALTWTVSAEGTYTVKAAEDATHSEATMSGSAVISYKTATAISIQPTTAVTGHDGVSVTLGSGMSVAGASISYKWYSYTSSGGAGEAVIAGATSSTYAVTNSKGTYYYKVEVIGTCGSVKSNMITLTVDNKHLLTYNANNGSGAPGSSYIAPGSTTLSSTMPTRSGYIFLGWNTNSSGTGDMYQPSATYTMPATATTLWAAWGSACFNVSDASKKTMPDGQPAGTVITGGGMINGTITGGTLTYTGTDVAGLNGNAKGLIFNNDNDELTVNITDGMLQEGTVIVIGSYGTASSSSHTNGLNVSGNNMSPETVVSSTSNNSISQRYVVADGDGIEGTSSFTIRRVASTDQMMLNTISVAGCMSCTSITPSLSYDNTTLYAVGGKPREARPTLTDNTSGGAVTYSSSNTDVVTVNASTGLVTAVGAGTATVTATIAAVDDYCPARASVNFTVPALVNQSIRVGKSTSWNGDGSAAPDMTFPADPTSTLTQNTVIGWTGYTFSPTANGSDDRGGMTAKFTGVPSSTSKNDSYYLSLSFNTPSYNVLLSNVVVPIQPVSKTVSAIATLYDGSTTITSSEVADIPAGAVKQAVFTFTPTVFAAGSTITVKVFVYDQATDEGFRLASPIQVSGCVLEAQRFTNANSTGNWSDPANWDSGSLPEIYHDVVIEKPATVDIAHATAKSIVIYNNSSDKTGKLTVGPNKGLEVAETVRKTTDGSSYSGTGEADLVLESNEYGNASLIFNNNNNCQATVMMYSKATVVGNTWNWQYVGTPFKNEIPLYNYYGSWMYKWNGAGWTSVSGQDKLTPFIGYCLTQEGTTTHVMSGELVATDEGDAPSFTVAAGGSSVIANSWTAPIHIASFTASTFPFEPATIYLFNTGSAEKGSSVAGVDKFAANTYEAVPIETGEYVGSEYIAPMQGFFIKNTTGDNGTITLKYDELVRPADSRAIVGGPMHAPSRERVDYGKPDVMKIWANGSEYNDRVVILAREDFSEGFDNGWDGEKLSFGNASPSVYVINEEGGYDAVSAIPEYEGTLVGFRAGSEDNVYTMTFEYNGDEVLYLNDLKAQMSAEIATGQTYMFTTEDGDSEVRFIISHNPIRRITTGVDDVETGTKARKVLINEKIYIIRKGRVYSVDGSLIK